MGFCCSGGKGGATQVQITWGDGGGKEGDKQGLFLEAGFSERRRGPEKEKRERHPAALCEQREREGKQANTHEHLTMCWRTTRIRITAHVRTTSIIPSHF